jgi:ABC-type transport system involved in cytochrome bd biosynthesis fused ATPase/permease subunit
VTVEAVRVGRRYGRFWASRDLTLQLPAGSITAVVGPNGAGKTTLLNLLVGLLPPSEGELSVVGQRPGNDPGFLAKVGFVAQDCPLHTEFTAEDLLRFGRHLNPKWDDALARDRLDAANVPLRAAGGTAVGRPEGPGGAGFGRGQASGHAPARRTARQPGPPCPAGVPAVVDGDRSVRANHGGDVVAPDR